MVEVSRAQDLAAVAAQKLIYLTTIGRVSGKLHTVELWFAPSNNVLYLSHEGKKTDWMKNIQKNSQVSFEIGGKIFRGNAKYLENGTEEAWVAKLALYEKYYGKAGREVVEDWFSLSHLLAIQ
jgi:deazaflavin-dependent oxidoreductase (nitroreductase family)